MVKKVNIVYVSFFQQLLVAGQKVNRLKAFKNILFCILLLLSTCNFS